MLIVIQKEQLTSLCQLCIVFLFFLQLYQLSSIFLHHRDVNMQAQAAVSQNASTDLQNQVPTTSSTLKGKPQSSSGSQISKEEELKIAQAAEREKRAAAAERRRAAAEALSAQGNSTATAPSTAQPKSGVAGEINCSCCNVSLAGKVPFHRYNYKYCSTSCMHVHREILEDG